MVVFAVVSVTVILAVALVGVITAQFDADDLRQMGIRR